MEGRESLINMKTALRLFLYYFCFLCFLSLEPEGKLLFTVSRYTSAYAYRAQVGALFIEYTLRCS
jgi:hypothetical protein